MDRLLHRIYPIGDIYFDHARPAVAHFDADVRDLHRVGEDLPAPRPVEPAVAAHQRADHDSHAVLLLYSALSLGNDRFIQDRDSE